MRFMHRRNVDLPHPEGPISAVIDCLWISSVTPLTASAVPYETERSSMSKTTSLLVGALARGRRSSRPRQATEPQAYPSAEAPRHSPRGVSRRGFPGRGTHDVNIV